MRNIIVTIYKGINFHEKDDINIDKFNWPLYKSILHFFFILYQYV